MRLCYRRREVHVNPTILVDCFSRSKCVAQKRELDVRSAPPARLMSWQSTIRVFSGCGSSPHSFSLRPSLLNCQPCLRFALAVNHTIVRVAAQSARSAARGAPEHLARSAETDWPAAAKRRLLAESPARAPLPFHRQAPSALSAIFRCTEAPTVPSNASEPLGVDRDQSGRTAPGCQTPTPSHSPSTDVELSFDRIQRRAPGR